MTAHDDAIDEISHSYHQYHTEVSVYWVVGS